MADDYKGVDCSTDYWKVLSKWDVASSSIAMRLALCDELTNGNGDKVRRVVIPWAWHLNGDLVLTGGSRNETCVGGGGGISKRTEGEVPPPAAPTLPRAPATATPAVLCCLLIIARRWYFIGGLIKRPCRARAVVCRRSLQTQRGPRTAPSLRLAPGCLGI